MSVIEYGSNRPYGGIVSQNVNYFPDSGGYVEGHSFRSNVSCIVNGEYILGKEGMQLLVCSMFQSIVNELLTGKNPRLGVKYSFSNSGGQCIVV